MWSPSGRKTPRPWANHGASPVNALAKSAPDVARVALPGRAGDGLIGPGPDIFMVNDRRSKHHLQRAWHAMRTAKIAHFG